MEYDRAARKRLGRAVRAARTSAGYANRADFADKMKRSTRQVQALENGEDGVGPDTWAAAAEALGWPVEEVYRLLEGEVYDLSEAITPVDLHEVADELLVAEVLRRMRAGAAAVEQDTGRLTLAARTTGRAPAGQRQADEERAAELGAGVVAESLREKRRQALQNDDGVTDEHDIG